MCSERVCSDGRREAPLIPYGDPETYPLPSFPAPVPALAWQPFPGEEGGVAAWAVVRPPKLWAAPLLQLGTLKDAGCGHLPRSRCGGRGGGGAEALSPFFRPEAFDVLLLGIWRPEGHGVGKGGGLPVPPTTPCI